MKLTKGKAQPTKTKTELPSALDIQERLSEPVIDELPETYTPVNQLYVPQEAVQFYKEQGYELHWKRIYTDETRAVDLKNIQKIESAGYEFVPRKDIPGLSDAMSKFFSEKLADDTYGLYVIGDLALAKIRTAKMKSKRKYLDDLTRSRSKAIIDDLRRNSVLPDPSRGEEFRTQRSSPKTRQVEIGE